MQQRNTRNAVMMEVAQAALAQYTILILHSLTAKLSMHATNSNSLNLLAVVWCTCKHDGHLVCQQVKCQQYLGSPVYYLTSQ